MALLFYEMKHWHFSNMYVLRCVRSTFGPNRSVKLVWRKKILEAKTFLVVFKTPRQMEKPGQGRSLNQVQHLKVINKQQPVQVTAFLFTLTRSLMKFYSISRVQTRSKFQLNRNTAIITGLDGCT